MWLVLQKGKLLYSFYAFTLWNQTLTPITASGFYDNYPSLRLEFFQKIMLVSAFGARLRKHLIHLWDNFSKGLQRKKQKGTDSEIKRESIIRFCNCMHGIFKFTKTEFSFPWGLLSRYSLWSGNVRSILCWFYGWEDENCSEIAVVVSWGTTEFLLIHFF